MASVRRTAFTEYEASIVKGMLLRGDPQDQIACFFQINQGRVGDIASCRKHHDVIAAPNSVLPRPGPYYIAEHVDWQLKEANNRIGKLKAKTKTDASVSIANKSSTSVESHKPLRRPLVFVRKKDQ